MTRMGSAVQPEPEAAEMLWRYYGTLLRHLGPQRWWPARTRLEIIVGAILTQNTAWTNATLALRRLRKAGLLNLERLERASLAELENCVRPAGFYRQKALTIRRFVRWLAHTCGGSLTTLFARPVQAVRLELLKIRGLGPETVDAILLYAGRHPVFVADAYARRILARHQLVPATAGYAAVQQLMHRHLPADPKLFNEYHALLVEVGKRFCRRQRPDCRACPLGAFLPQGSLVSVNSCKEAIAASCAAVG